MSNINAWKKLSRDDERSAQKLKDAGYLRGCISRAYYAVYSAATMHMLASGYIPDARKEGPPHGEVLNLVGRIDSISRERLEMISGKIRILYRMRLDADYFANKNVDARMAGTGLTICRSVLKEFSIL